MSIRTKFVCSSVRKFQHWDRKKGMLYEFELNPVTSGSEENEQFYEATPSGGIKLSTLSEDHFQVGKEYYVDFTESD